MKYQFVVSTDIYLYEKPQENCLTLSRYNGDMLFGGLWVQYGIPENIQLHAFIQAVLLMSVS